MRGTFADVRIRNQIAPDTEGLHYLFPSGDVTSIFDASRSIRLVSLLLFLQDHNSGTEVVVIGRRKVLFSWCEGGYRNPFEEFIEVISLNGVLLYFHRRRGGE